MPKPNTGTRPTSKVEGKKAQKPTNRSGPIRKEYTSKLVGLESHLFDIGNAKYTATFQKSMDAIAIHIQCEDTGGPDIAKAIRDLVFPSVSLPPYPTGSSGNPPDPGEIYLWQQSITKTNKRKLLIEENKKRAYGLVFGQCLPKLISKIKSSDSFASGDIDQDVVQLLFIVRGYCCQFDNHQQGTWALRNAKHRVLVFYQGYNMSMKEYIKNFKALVSVVETYGGAYGCEPGQLRAQLIKQGESTSDLDAPDLTELKKAEEICHEQYLSCMLLQGADQSSYSKLKDDLSNEMTKEVYNFPKTIVKMLQLMSNYKVPARAKCVKDNGKVVAFVPDREVMSTKDIECWHCSKKGHY